VRLARKLSLPKHCAPILSKHLTRRMLVCVNQFC
jgi:hypothetical protein